jgi:hypothetical protein
MMSKHEGNEKEEKEEVVVVVQGLGVESWKGE